MEQPTIAATILEQLKALGQIEMMCWGFNTPIDMGDGLKFKVQGRKFRGRVYIKLNGGDLYDIDFATVRKAVWTVKHSVTDIFFDQMVEVIDDYVET